MKPIFEYALLIAALLVVWYCHYQPFKAKQPIVQKEITHHDSPVFVGQQQGNNIGGAWIPSDDPRLKSGELQEFKDNTETGVGYAYTVGGKTYFSKTQIGFGYISENTITTGSNNTFIGQLREDGTPAMSNNVGTGKVRLGNPNIENVITGSGYTTHEIGNDVSTVQGIDWTKASNKSSGKNNIAIGFNTTGFNTTGFKTIN